ncbi:DUF7059 domain-containing protein [Tomitella gaofuii]|uniref:DUF7782 domain-containing protein n=2 Tax=Tomitella gaofuii TaxID=2760083 RepID=UPI0015FBD76A|nr:methyltransferase [Tomitella gaofuii]
MSMHTPGASPLVTLAPRLREAFLAQGYDADTLLAILGDDGHDALGRGEPVPVRRAAAGAGHASTLIRLLLVGDDCPRGEAAAALAPVDIDEAVAAGLLEADGDSVRAALDVRPMDLGAGTRWMISDLDGSMRARATAPDHVLGVGHASLSLLRATPTAPADAVLDVGTGCGVQAVHAAGYARRVAATDVSARALEFAAAGCVLNDVDVELLRGPWYGPAAGRRFDRIVANPPFVVGRGTVDHTYRDSGLPLDGASETMISGALAHLAPHGVATMLASWVHLRGEDWRSRVAGWLPDDGLEAWVVQRDVADPALYVGTWMRDAGLDPRDPAHAALADDWLAHFEAAGVEGVGFGFVYLQRTDEPTSVTAEDLRHGFDDPLGDEALDHLARAAWLRRADVASSRFRFDAATALERVLLPTAAASSPTGSPGAAPGRDAPTADEATWREAVTRLHRGGGPRWQHEVDEASLQLLTGLGRGELTTAQVAGLLAAARGADADALIGEATALVTALVRHGLLRPAAGNP